MNIIIKQSELEASNNKGVSININNNKNNTSATGKITGAYSKSAVVSLGNIDTKKLDNNTYASLIKEADDIKEQLKISADNAKASLKALFIRLSGVDAVKMDEQGFNLTDASPEQCVNIVEKIKIQLAMHSDSAVATTGSMSLEKIEEVAGSAGFANEIASRLNNSGMPVSEENIKSVQGVLDKTANISDLSYEDKKNLVSSNSDITLDNIYKVQHISGYQSQNVNNFGANSQYGGKQQITDEAFSQLVPQIENVIKSAGLEVNDKTLSMAKDFLNSDIPMTKESFSKMSALDSVSIPDLLDKQQLTDYIDKIIENMAVGNDAGSVSLTNESGVISQVAQAIDVINNSSYIHVSKVVEDGKVFNIQNLKQAIVDINMAYDTYIDENVDNNVDINVDILNGNNSKNVDIYYAQLQELKMLMTANSGAFLVKQGVNLNIMSIFDINKQLYNYEERIFNEKIGDIDDLQQNVDNFGVKNAIYQSEYENSDDNEINNSKELSGVTVYQASVYIKKALFDMSTAPDVVIGAVLKEKNDSEAVTISDFASTGSGLKKKFDRAGQTYEAVGTQVRRDLGDSVKKAVNASTKDILEGLGLESTKANEDAVRILAVNSMDMTKENIENVKAVYQTLQSLISNMTPQTVLNMIRDNINPLKDDINDLNNYVQQKNNVDNIDDTKLEKYSKFLYKLDKTDGISSEDREKFIGIYKMLNIFTKDAGAAVGALVKQNAQVTMGNLYTAYQSRKSYGMEAVINDTTGVSNIGVNYFNNLFENTSSKITPLTLRDVNNEQNIDERSVEGFCEAVSDKYDFNKEAEYYSEAYNEYLENIRQSESSIDTIISELESSKTEVTMGNVYSAFNVSQKDYYSNVEKRLDSVIEKDTSFKDSIADIFNDFEDSLIDNVTIENKYSELKEVVEKQLNKVVNKNGDTTFSQIEALRNINKEIGYIKDLSLRQDYKIPVVMGNDVRTVNLTLIQDDNDKGRISVEFDDDSLGHVSVEAKVNENSADIYVMSDSNTDKNVEELINTRLENVSTQLKEQIGIDRVNINYGKNDNTVRVTYNNEAKSIPTQKLYQISKFILKGMSGK